jgi:DNA mismatch endonuclease (patch repair protein)
LHRADLPGKPDVYVGRIRLAIFVNGCFWHGHDCRRGHLPSTNREFWEKKIRRNGERDREVSHVLRELGIDVLVLWTCAPDSYAAAADEIAERYYMARS